MASSHPVLRRILPPITLHPGVVGVRGTLYDVRNWAVSHPGGAFLVRAYDGCDATRLYETHHLDVARSDAALARLPVVGTYAPLAPPVGRAYEGVREAARALLPTRASRRAPWGVACARALVVVACALAHLALLLVREPWGATWVFALAVSALCNTLVGALGHNAVHTLRPLALGLDWNGLSAYEWLHEHVHSHHMYTNTPMDHDAVSMLPFLSWLPADAKPAVGAKPRRAWRRGRRGRRGRCRPGRGTPSTPSASSSSRRRAPSSTGCAGARGAARRRGCVTRRGSSSHGPPRTSSRRGGRGTRSRPFYSP